MTATVKRASPTIRAATNADGERIGWLLWQAGFTIDGIDWSRVEPNWIVAEHEGRIVGAIQVLPGVPIAVMERLSIEQTLPKRLKAVLARELCYEGCRVLRAMGAQFVSGMVIEERHGFRNVLERRGVRKLITGHLYMLKVR